MLEKKRFKTHDSITCCWLLKNISNIEFCLSFFSWTVHIFNELCVYLMQSILIILIKY